MKPESAGVTLYGAVVVAQLAAQASVRLRPQLRAAAVVVMEGVRPHERLYSASLPALALGLTPGMTRVEVESFPGVCILPRSLSEETAAGLIVLEAAGLFTPRVERCAAETPSLECLLDLSGTERLLGAPAALGRKILDHLASLGFTASIALCENADAALSLARAGKPAVTAPAQTQQALAPLALDVLNLAEEERERFAGWGIDTLGELAALPERDVIARLGQAGKRLLLRARGELPHLLQPAEPAFDLSECVDFEEPVETLEPLLFSINPMLEQLVLRAQTCALALAAVTITLTLYCPADRSIEETPEAAAGAVFMRSIRPAVPTLHRPLLLKMLQLDLEAHAPPGAVIRLQLAAEPGQTSRIQLGLFSPPMPEPTRFEDTHARLISIVGETNVGRLRPLDTHAEESWTLERFKLPTAITLAATPRSEGSRPGMAMRRLRPPAPISVSMCADTRSIHSFFFESRRFKVERCYGPWRSSGHWWQPGLWSCDTWDLAARAVDDDELLLCVITLDLLRKQWQLTGIYD